MTAVACPAHICVVCRSIPVDDPDYPKTVRATDIDVHPRTPRCATHRRSVRKAQKQRRRATYVETTYGIPQDVYDALLAFQGGKCAICQRATGKSKALAVDHDHDCCPGPTSCGECVRGLCCSTCNRIVLGRYDAAALTRAITYFRTPPMLLLRASRSGDA